MDSRIISPPLLELRGISKSYPAVKANDRVDLSVGRGEIHALLGENGAGKSTLMKIVYGAVKPDAGKILWQGQEIIVENPAQARRLGIGMVFQHFALFESLTVAENIQLSIDQPPSKQKLSNRITEISEHYGLPIAPDRLVHSMSVGERQRVEIVRCLLQNPKLLIMDEPTSVLTPQAVLSLFETLRRLADEGCSILYISHKLEEIRALCSKATVMRAGRVTGSAIPKEETSGSLARMMTGSIIPDCKLTPRTPMNVELALRNVSQPNDEPFGVTLQNINLSVRGGEIVGIAGISGNGQKELMNIISGETLLNGSGTVEISSEIVSKLSPDERRKRGLNFVPEERLGRGAVPQMALSHNALLTGAGHNMVKWGIIQPLAMRIFAEQVIAKFKVSCSGPTALASSLSGGNLQKYIVGREISLAPKVMVVSQPTWGVDVGSSMMIRQALIDLREQGVAVLVISEELDELFMICDRIAVLNQGQLSETTPIHETRPEKIGLLMSSLNSAST